MLVQELMEQQETLLSDHSVAVCNLTDDEQKLISELQTNRAGNENNAHDPPEQTLTTSFQPIRGLDNSKT